MSGALSVGDAVTWRHTPRGGYGYDWRIPAVVVAVTPKRVRVALLKQGELALGYRVVTPERCEKVLPQFEPIVSDIRRLLGGEL